MNKLFVLYRRHYGDFDIAQDIPVAVSSDQVNLVVFAANLNSKRTQADLDAEIGFWVGDSPEVILL